MRRRPGPSLHAEAIDPSGFKPNRRNRSASSAWPCLISRSASIPANSRAAARLPASAWPRRICTARQAEERVCNNPDTRWLHRLTVNRHAPVVCIQATCHVRARTTS